MPGAPVMWFDTYPAPESAVGPVANPAAYARQVASLVRLTRVTFGATPVVLFLREFDSDEKAGGTERHPKVMPFLFEEEILAAAVDHLGTLIAIAKPSESLRSLGALRIKAAHRDWQHVVRYLLANSSLAILKLPLSMTTGIRWEINQIGQSLPKEKILLLVPNAPAVLHLLEREFPRLGDAVLSDVKRAMRRTRAAHMAVGVIGTDRQGDSFFAPIRSTRASPWTNNLRVALRRLIPKPSEGGTIQGSLGP